MERQGSPTLFSSDSERDSPVQGDAFNVGATSSKPFSEEIVAVLSALYEKGMVGWGRSHEKDIHTAISATGLSRSQVQVGCKLYVTIYIYIYIYVCLFIDMFAYLLTCLFIYVKNWVRRRNMKRKHAGESDVASLRTKKVHLTPWQHYLKSFAKTQGSKFTHYSSFLENYIVLTIN